MPSTKNRTTLYRFVSLRGVELSKKENQEKRFVFHPDNITGPFFDAIKNKPANETKVETLQKTATNFSALNELSEFEKIEPNFFGISNWLAQNINADISLILSKIKSLKPLELKTELIL